MFDRHSGVDLVDAVAASTANGWGMHLAAQVDELRDRGSNVEPIFPDGN